ncbi:Hpt domain-containing protein [Cyclobacterium marinum]|uniref:Multi-sensor hybrid histidine kinase n=1 Tax=Cyclobacterium marinum (strain ATCC 25205 / DSM 745 / LMG 13164 / NCIMB 1802) TaxID=880070 RepID=G0IWD0_CYCMS|nr:Hpt domain-containing protein [Cyclobacterium marinum]AEL27118.1 multi-sensor hybrid histidine kinase [Cyclobacterium marinum DSM 745]
MDQGQKKLYNLVNLEEISGGSQEFINEMIKLFISQAEITIDGFNQAINKKDFATIRDLAHQIKPSIDNIKITTLMPIIREVERLAETEGTSENLALNIDTVNSELEIVIQQLQMELN